MKMAGKSTARRLGHQTEAEASRTSAEAAPSGTGIFGWNAGASRDGPTEPIKSIRKTRRRRTDMVDLSRRQLGATAIGGLIAANPSVSRAQAGGRLVIGNWGGDSQKILEDIVVTPHLRPQGIDAVFDAASEPPRKVKVLAEKALPRGTLDVAGLSDAGGYELWQNGALANIDYSQIAEQASIIPSIRKPAILQHASDSL